MVIMKLQPDFIEDTRGDAVVEATILFPIIMMIFAGLMLLAVYLPVRMTLQHNTQYAATALATRQSDTWLDFDTSSMKYVWYKDKGSLPNVYASVLASFFMWDTQDDAEIIVKKLDGKSITTREGNLTVDCEIYNRIIYKEITVTASKRITMPVDLSFVKFPKEIDITVSSTAVVLNGDEFVRNMDLAAEFVTYLEREYGLPFSQLGEWMNKVYGVLGI